MGLTSRGYCFDDADFNCTGETPVPLLVISPKNRRPGIVTGATKEEKEERANGKSIRSREPNRGIPFRSRTHNRPIGDAALSGREGINRLVSYPLGGGHSRHVRILRSHRSTASGGRPVLRPGSISIGSTRKSSSISYKTAIHPHRIFTCEISRVEPEVLLRE